MKRRVLAVVVPLAAIVALLVAPGIALADQACHTQTFTFHSAQGNESEYPLKKGFVISTHMNGPVLFEKKEFQLHGARPNTQYFIYRAFPDGLGPYAPDQPVYSGFSFWTDKHGDGHIITPLPPDNPTFVTLKQARVTSLRLYNLLYDGLVEEGGVRAYESDTLTTYLDFKWTP